MNQFVQRAIFASQASLQLRHGKTELRLPNLPESIHDFLSEVRGGILFPVPSEYGQDPHGFEILDSTLLWSVSELLGDNDRPDRQSNYFDKCHVLFSAVDDQCLMVGVDMNADRLGWIFVTNLNPGNSPNESTFYQARSFEEWLELNLRTYSPEHPELWTMRDIPKIGQVGN
jgi:hypothetical protein